MSLALVTAARAGTNSWIDGTGKWETPGNWSAGAPSSSDSADLVTNIGNKTVTIDAVTSTNFPATLLINNLAIAGAGGATNTLQVVNIGTIAAPLSVLTNIQLLGGAALIISNAGQVYGSNAVVGGLPATSNNLVVVTDSNSVWSLRGSLIIGSNSANNSLIISNRGTVSDAFSQLGLPNGGGNNVSALVTGTNSLWVTTTEFGMNVATPGISLTVAKGGRFVVGSLYAEIGSGANANGDVVLVTDPGSTWSNACPLQISGFSSSSQFIISNGASAYSASALIGPNVGTYSNSVVVTGPGSVWIVGGSITISDAGSDNSLTVTNGGLVTAQAEDLAQSGGGGFLIVAGGTNDVFTSLNVGLTGGTGTVSVLDGALFVTNITATAQTTVNTNSTLILGAGEFKTDHLVVTNGGVVQYNRTYQVDNSTVTVASGGNVQANANYVIAPSVTSTAVVDVTGGLLVVSNGVLGVGNNGTVTTSSGAGKMAVSNGTLVTSVIAIGNSSGAQCDLILTDGGVISDGGCPSGTNCLLVINSLGFTQTNGTANLCATPVELGVTAPADSTISGDSANDSFQNLYAGYSNIGTFTLAGGAVNICAQFVVGHLGLDVGSVIATGAVWVISPPVLPPDLRLSLPQILPRPLTL